jgi:hypothetical protein
MVAVAEVESATESRDRRGSGRVICLGIADAVLSSSWRRGPVYDGFRLGWTNKTSRGAQLCGQNAKPSLTALLVAPDGARPFTNSDLKRTIGGGGER